MPTLISSHGAGARPSAVALIPLLVLAAGCGHREAAAAAFAPLEAENAAHLRVEVVDQKEDDDRLILGMRLVNDGAHTVQLRSPPSSHVDGFALAADSHPPQGADAGSYSARSQAAQLLELPAGTASELDVTWTFDPPLAHAHYPWTLTIGNLAQDGHALGDITLTWTPEAP